MAENRGKQFEGVVKDSFNKLRDCSIDRLHDQTTGFAGSSNICDFIVYKYPTIIYLECKSCHGNTWSLSNLTDNQYKGLLEKCKYKGTVPGIMIWWIDRDITKFIHIEDIKHIKEQGAKSIKFDSELGIKIPGKKKRVFFDYDMSVLF